jgi:predicted metal-dependent peptidase
MSADPSTADSDAQRKALLSELDNLLHVAANTRAALSEVEERVSRTRDLAAGGSNVEVFLTSFTEPGRASTDLTAAINALERARRRTRRQIVLMGRGEGLSLGQLAAFWGVSRQLISRLTREPLEEHGPPPER